MLYVLMGIAAWRVWLSPGSKGWALGLFGAQLAANALWSWLFFASALMWAVWRLNPELL